MLFALNSALVCVSFEELLDLLTIYLLSWIKVKPMLNTSDRNRILEENRTVRKPIFVEKKFYKKILI